jgi:hypothetical protein
MAIFRSLSGNAVVVYTGPAISGLETLNSNSSQLRE